MARFTHIDLQVELAQLEALIELIDNYAWGPEHALFAPLLERARAAEERVRALNEMMDAQMARVNDPLEQLWRAS